MFGKREVDSSSGEAAEGPADDEEYPLDDFDVPLGRLPSLCLEHIVVRVMVPECSVAGY